MFNNDALLPNKIRPFEIPINIGICIPIKLLKQKLQRVKSDV